MAHRPLALSISIQVAYWKAQTSVKLSISICEAQWMAHRPVTISIGIQVAYWKAQTSVKLSISICVA